MVIILVLVYIATFFFIARLFSKREGYYSTVVIFGLATYIYYIGIPFEMALLNLHSITSGIIRFTMSTTQLSHIVVMGIIAFLSFSIGYHFSRFNPFKDSLVKSKISSKKSIRYSLIFLWILSLVVIPIFFNNYISASSTYEGAIITKYNNPICSLIITYALMTTALIVATIIKKGKVKYLLLGIGLVFIIFLWSIYSSDRNPLLIGLLALGTYFIGSKVSKKFSFLPMIILVAFIGIFLFKMYNVYILGSGQISINDVFTKHFAIRKSDPLGPFLSLTEILNNPIEFKYGSTYINIFYIIIPRAVWSKRPLDLSEQFARENIPYWSGGQGLGFSLLAEAYLNFSWWGIFIQYFLIGLLWGLFWKYLLKLFFWHYTPLLRQSLYTILGYYFLIIMHRSTVAIFFKSVMLLTTLFVLFVIIFDLSIIKKKTMRLMAKQNNYNYH